MLTKRQPLIRQEVEPFSPLNLRSLPTPIDFEEDGQITKTIHANSNKKIVLIKNLNNSGYSIAKIYCCYDKTRKKVKKRVKLLYDQYQVVKYAGLNEYFRLYYDESTHQLMIHQQCYQQSLTQFINTNGPVCDERKAKHMMYGILTKLKRLHQYEYVHCDIHPGNIMERKLDHLYTTRFIKDGWLLIDFDSMQKYKTKTCYKGTIGWTAPEIDFDSKKNVYRYSSDIFSFGLLLLYVITGEQPLQMPHVEKKKCAKNNGLQFPDTQAIIKEEERKEKMKRVWYYKHVKKYEKAMHKYLIRMVYENKISVELFDLLCDGLLVFDASKRWNCEQILQSKWFYDVRCEQNKK